MNQATKPQTQYVNLLADGFGFMNRLRKIEVKKGGSHYYGCTLMLLRGDESEKSRFDVRIAGSEAKALIERMIQEYPALLSDDYKARPSVTCSVRIGDLVPSFFEGKDKQVVPYIDGRLIKFKYISINGSVFYRAADETTTTEETDSVELTQAA
ncbi:DUF3577 domain-containing protein [Stenoxybacter acetivorans]|uniref:DUF3577 domain-containing protein n=1 Tax=Stenoxybacter acetivorans TaxID=422441 RepID=UPI00068ADDE8|nr:DUF3577 domain-containing protein [Stenoxybacter acetivorans]